MTDLISAKNAVNFADIVHLRRRTEGVAPGGLELLVRRWFAMSVLRGRYCGSPELQTDFDVHQFDSRGVKVHVDAVIPNDLRDGIRTSMLPQFSETSSVKSPRFP